MLGCVGGDSGVVIYGCVWFGFGVLSLVGVVCYKFVVSVLGLGCFDVWCCGAVLGGACRFDVC